MAAGLILLLVYFVWLAAQRARTGRAGRWPPHWCFRSSRWCRSSRHRPAARPDRDRFMHPEAAGLYFSFTGDAQGWFNA